MQFTVTLATLVPPDDIANWYSFLFISYSYYRLLCSGKCFQNCFSYDFRYCGLIT